MNTTQSPALILDAVSGAIHNTLRYGLREFVDHSITTERTPDQEVYEAVEYGVHWALEYAVHRAIVAGPHEELDTFVEDVRAHLKGGLSNLSYRDVRSCVDWVVEEADDYISYSVWEVTYEEVDLRVRAATSPERFWGKENDALKYEPLHPNLDKFIMEIGKNWSEPWIT